jgi:hypothetical protein
MDTKNKTMGLIREPKNVDFTVLDKPWTDKERKEFSAFIKLRKEQRKKRATQPAPHKRRGAGKRTRTKVVV